MTEKKKFSLTDCITRKHAISYNNKTFNKNEENFENTSLTYSKFYNCIFEGINFYNAAVTGSVFENCTFKNCNLDDADLEYCEFRKCSFNSKEINNASFNNSNFVESNISNISFRGCTFTGTYWEQSIFLKIKILFSTLEGACFSNCSFKNLDLRNLNLEYVEFISPKMNKVILPIFQIPYIFGLLSYFSITKDDVKVATDKEVYNLDTYFDSCLPIIFEDYEKKKLFFPMSNVLIFGKKKDLEKAKVVLMDGIMKLAMDRDYRGIKFCCKLMASSNLFKKRELDSLYKAITNIGATFKTNSAEMKSYFRHIGEIKSILYKKNKIPRLIAKFSTNFGIESTIKFANLINLFHQIGKPNHTNEIELSINLSYNSPLIIEIIAKGNINYFYTIMQGYFNLCKISEIEYSQFPLIADFKSYSKDLLLVDSTMNLEKLKKQFLEDNVQLALLEYYTEDCEEILNYSCNSFYLNDEPKLIGIEVK